ncbi:MAG: alpha/beta fold hydrolase [Chloroflexota bacterium]
MRTTANGISVGYDVSGTGPTVTLIHALGLERSSWWKQLPEFELGWQTVSHDVRGHGETDKPDGPYSIDLFAADLVALLAALRVERTALVGVSMGGMIAQAVALQAPELISTLVLCSTTGGYDEWQRETFRQRAADVRRAGMGPLIASTLERWFTPAYRRSQPAVLERIAQTLRSNDAAGYAAACEAVGSHDLRSRLGGIRWPTLVVAGEADPSMTPATARDLAARIPCAQLEIISQAAHLVPIERAEAFNGLATKHLRAALA